jgi:hypothetical protein
MTMRRHSGHFNLRFDDYHGRHPKRPAPRKLERDAADEILEDWMAAGGDVPTSS